MEFMMPNFLYLKLLSSILLKLTILILLLLVLFYTLLSNTFGDVVNFIEDISV